MSSRVEGTSTAKGREVGSTSPYHVVGELAFDDMDALQAALASPEGQAASEDYARIAPGGSLLLVAEDIT